MLELPKIPYKMEKNQRQSVALRGINFSNMINDGDIVDSKNISARAYPYLTTRKSRASMGDYSGVTAMTVFRDKFVVVKEGDLIYDGKTIGKVLPGEKQFATINTKLCIMPDKKYLDGETLTLHDMGAEIFGRGVTFGKDSVTINETSYVVANGYGRFSGNTFTSGTRQVWKYNADLYPDGKLVVYKTAECTVRDIHTVLIRGLPEELHGELVGNRLALASIELFYRDVGTITNSWNDAYGVYVSVTGTIGAVSADSQFCQITFGNILKSGDIIKLAIDGETRDNVIMTSDSQVDTQDTQLPDKMVSAYSCDIRKYIFPDLTALFEKDWICSFSDNSMGKITAVTRTTVTIDTPFTNVEDAYTVITREGRGLYVFKEGDFITISNSANNNITFGIDKIEGNTIYTENEIFTEGEDSNVITVERKIPDLDYICESNNRIWGCSNKDRSIYASALGDPTNFFDYSGESTDSYAVAVGSEGDFTACCGYGGAVLFFKETKLHKVLGSYPAEYSLYDYEIEGVQSGSNKSLSIINEVLYYKGIHGVFAFNGSPHLISQNFGDKEFGNAVAGNDGDTYYISMSDGKREYLFAYETEYDMWLLEDDKRVKDFARRGGNTYALCEGGEFFLCAAGESETDIEWFVQFAPLYETIDGKKSYSRIVFRLEIPRGSYLIVDVKTDDGAWREAGTVIGKRDGIVPVSIPINRCDKFELRLRGKGKATIHSMMREFFVGGDK